MMKFIIKILNTLVDNIPTFHINNAEKQENADWSEWAFGNYSSVE